MVGIKNINKIKNFRLKELVITINLLQRRREHWLRSFQFNIVPDEEKENRTHLSRIEKLRNKGILVTNNRRTFFTKHLSLGCITCLSGETYNIVPTFECNKRCFFCYQPRFQYHTIKRNRKINYPPVIGINDLLKKDKIKSISISGGEPLLEVNKVIRYIYLIRRHFDSDCRIHLYTNGTLITNNILKQLRDAGLDEIRINLTANNYCLTPVCLAKQYIPEVIVEIPVIPEHESKIKNIMPILDKLQIFCLNLHELLFFGYNSASYKKRRYMLKTFKKRPFYSELAIPIYGSEETAFRLLEFAVDKRFSISVHYCSANAKQEIQHIRKRYNYAIEARVPYERITKNGLLEKVIVYEPDHIVALNDLRQKNIPKEQININLEKRRLETHPDNLKYLNFEKYEVGIVHSLPDSRDVYIRVIS